MTPRQRLNRLRDLTTEIRGEWDRMLELADRLSALIDTAQHAIITANLEGEIVSWNPAAVRMFGWLESEVIGQKLTIIIPHRYRDRHLAGLAHYKETGEGAIIGKPYRMPALARDGREFPVDITVQGFQTGGGRFVSAIVREPAHAEVRDG